MCIASIADWFVHGKTRYRTPKLASPEYVDGIEAFEAKGTSTGSLGKAEH